MLAQEETAIDSISDTSKRLIEAKQTNIKKTGTLQIANDTLSAVSGGQTFQNDKDDSVLKAKPKMDVKTNNQPVDSFYLKLLNNPYTRSNKEPLFLVINERKRNSKDELFYLLSGLMALLAFIKLIFNRYFSNVFKLLFQPSFRQKHTKEQLLQGNVPSFFMNVFFIFSGGAYIALLVSYYHLSVLSFWYVFLYSSAALMSLYSAKYIILSFAGWVFNVNDAIDNYLFIVYLINKIIGVLLIPFILKLAFSGKEIIGISVLVSLTSVAILFVYRYIISFAPVRREIRVSISHFIIYMFAVEFLPLLLICKMLIIYLNNSH